MLLHIKNGSSRGLKLTYNKVICLWICRILISPQYWVGLVTNFTWVQGPHKYNRPFPFFLSLFSFVQEVLSVCCSGAFGLSFPLAHLSLSEVSYPIWKELCLQGWVCVCVLAWPNTVMAAPKSWPTGRCGSSQEVPPLFAEQGRQQPSTGLLRGHWATEIQMTNDLFASQKYAMKEAYTRWELGRKESQSAGGGENTV